jgi:hypothetical protein
MMSLPTSPRALLDAVSWHVRGMFATEQNRRIGFRARALWQPAEVEARRGMGRDIAAELTPALHVDRDAGHRVLSPSAMPSLDEVCSIGRSIIKDATPADGTANAEKKFSRIRVASFEERVALLRVGLDRRVLAMAAEYLGVLPVVSEADYFCSFPVDGPFTKSQLWHCDCDAGDVFKLFIYCDDVTDEDGPFEFIGPASSRRVRDAIDYRYAGRRYRVADDMMAAHVPASEITTMVGPAGTAFVVDTVRCFHRGSRITDKRRRRVMASVCYVPPSCLTIPRRLASEKAPLVEFTSAFTGELERAALGLPIATKWL